MKNYISQINALVKAHSAFGSLKELLMAPGNYSPSLDVSHPERLAIAEAYDKLQEEYGDARRAFRYGTPASAPAVVLTETASGYSAGDSYSIYLNQGDRDGYVLAVLGEKILFTYQMPAGRWFTGFAWPSQQIGSGDCYKSVSINSLPKCWQKAMANQGAHFELSQLADGARSESQGLYLMARAPQWLKDLPCNACMKPKATA